MSIKYSKPSSDIDIEMNQFTESDNKLIQEQLSVKKKQAPIKIRSNCIICDYSLTDIDVFEHRGTFYKSCKKCMHIQASEEILEEKVSNFEDIYPKLELKEWASRRDRIYTPKLEWIVRSLRDYGYDKSDLMDSKWLEFGSGAGYFLSSLQLNGYKNVIGIEENQSLIERSNEVLGSFVVKEPKKFKDEVMNSDVRIIVSFFVLEHLFEPWKILDIVASKPKGTIFIFSVPSFGFTTLLESITDSYAARNLDGIVHRQIFTDNSIDCMMKKMNYKKLSEWIFGQDTLDMKRYILKGIDKKFNHDLNLSSYIKSSLNKLIDPMQSEIDKAHFSDSRHILAIKQ